MKFIQYFDGHIIINFFGLLIRIKHYVKCKCPEVKIRGITDIPRKIPLVVSLTSFPERINTVIKTIKTLLNQTVKPDVIVLWLAPEQFPNRENDLPKELIELQKFGLTIDWYKDIRSYKKIIPALKKYPHSIIITTDDDIYYAKDTVETLYKSYLEHKNEVQAHRCDWITLCEKKTDSVSQENSRFPSCIIKWEKTRELYKDKHRGAASFHNRLTGYGAVLYPPDCFYKDVCNEELIKNTIPTHDDIWLWAMTALAGYKTRLVKGYSESINYIEDSQQYGLCKINKKGAGMDLGEAYDILLEYYPQIIEILKNSK